MPRNDNSDDGMEAIFRNSNNFLSATINRRKFLSGSAVLTSGLLVGYSDNIDQKTTSLNEMNEENTQSAADTHEFTRTGSPCAVLARRGP